MSGEASPRTARRLVSLVASCRDSGQLDQLNEILTRDWPTARLAELLCIGTVDAARCSAMALGLVGGMSHCPALVSALRHRDAGVAWSAEHALWSIWMRAGGREAQALLADIVLRMRSGDRSVTSLDELLRHFPVFAEAYHQRGLAHYLAGKHEKALHDYCRAAHLNPFHFAAMAGQGHCQAHLGRRYDALRAYVAARDLHPRLEGVRQAIRRLREGQAVEPELITLRYAPESVWPELEGSIARK